MKAIIISEQVLDELFHSTLQNLKLEKFEASFEKIGIEELYRMEELHRKFACPGCCSHQRIRRAASDPEPFTLKGNTR